MPWDSVTRGIYYDKDKVAARLRYYANQYEELGQVKEATMLRTMAREVAEGFSNVKEAAKLVIHCAEELAEEQAI